MSESQRSGFLTQIIKSYCGLVNAELTEQFNRFCRVDYISDSLEVNDEIILEHKMIREHFDKNYSRDETGRFVIRLPVKPTIVNLKGSFYKAKTILLKNERRKSDILEKAYCMFMSEYEKLGHMTKLKNFDYTNVDSENAYYIPHHMVIKITSSTNKYRVIFNASCKDESNTSRNDHLLEGPVIQPELFTNVTRFREFIIALAADIAHMYRQILIFSLDRIYQRNRMALQYVRANRGL